MYHVHMKILFYTHLTEEFPQIIKDFEKQYPDHQFVCAKHLEDYEREVTDSHILIYGRPSEHVLEIAKKLKLLIVPFAGVAQLDRNLLKEKGIRASNSHGNSLIVAERAMALAMACCGRIVEFHNDMKQGDWHRTGDPHKPFDYWFSLVNKNITILGTGAIGCHIARMLQGFSCNIKGFRKSSLVVPPYFDSVTNDLEDAIHHGDVLFFALPATNETENLITSEKMKLLHNKFVINVGRGSVLPEEDFYLALEKKEIRGAGIDAWYLYPSKENPQSTGSKFPFYQLPNVVISPHAASHAPEGKMGQLTGALEVIEQYLTTGIVLNEILKDY